MHKIQLKCLKNRQSEVKVPKVSVKVPKIVVKVPKVIVKVPKIVVKVSKVGQHTIHCQCSIQCLESVKACQTVRSNVFQTAKILIQVSQ